MRSQLARITKAVDSGPATVAFLVDLDGQTPVTLYLENMDQKAALQMRTGGTDVGSNVILTRSIAFHTHGSKNGCLKFEAVAAGAGGNANTLTITAAPSQAFSLTFVGVAGVINLLCDASGKPIQSASDILKAIAAATGGSTAAFRAAINSTLADGSDGSATMELESGSTTRVITTQNLAGGTAATISGVATVAVSPQSSVENGPWTTLEQPSTKLTAVVANTVKQATLQGHWHDAGGAATDFSPVPIVAKAVRVTVVGPAAADKTILVLTVVASPTR